MKIYIAGPFSHPEEREALTKMIEVVRKEFPTADIYVPMEYKVEDDYQLPDGTWHLPNHIWARNVYKHDIKKIEEADFVVAMYTGHYCSSGSIWEIGYACALRIPVILYIPEYVKEKDMSLMVLNGVGFYLSDSGKIRILTNDERSKFNQK